MTPAPHSQIPHSQLSLCCPCGELRLYRRGLCEPCCYHRRRRASNVPSALITLCRGCHARLHRLRTIDRWVPDTLAQLWAEQHPGAPRQLQLPDAIC